MTRRFPKEHNASWPRRLTGVLRVMPDFIIVGAQKCGTTSLYNYLLQHPGVIPAAMKEVHFFDLHYTKGTNWYRSHFPLLGTRALTRSVKQCKVVTGESSPYYLFHPHAPRRIRAKVPRAKLIFLLRNPVDRAYSEYQHEVRRRHETLSFEDAIEAEGRRLEGELPKMRDDEQYYSFAHQYHAYLSKGIYVDQLRVYEQLFPRHQMLILQSEEFYSEPSGVMSRVTEFLNLPHWKLREYRKYNHGNYSNMSGEIRRRLVQYFKPHNRRLYEYLGVDLGWDR